ncbi:MAG: HD domain-containing protein [Streptococcaceae bacterium]|jgi:HD superfamily phosphohydrolase|nr:HD domain-containing protein [Streptococcaceae bacterium]
MSFTDKVFRDPVHGYIHVEDEIIYQLINTAEFQRLRRIKQLGTSSFTFHGAEHSRFSHCLGVYHIAKTITDYFTESSFIFWNPEENLVTQCAALLHDVGHGAYSHTFEHLFETDHEAITREIIRSEKTEIGQVLRQVSPDFPDKVASVIAHEYPNPQVTALISSQIDADRMDYLLRDAYYTGAVYGNFDMTRILRFITPIENGIAFRQNGMHAVEDYIVSRYQMYMQVYFHPASRAMEVLLNLLLKRAKFLYPSHKTYFESTSPRLVPFFEGTWVLPDYLHLDDGVTNTYFQTWETSDDKILSDLATFYINRRVFKSVKIDGPSDKRLSNLTELVEAAGFDTDYYTGIHNNFDLPYDDYNPETSRTPIMIMDKKLQLTELSKLSPLVQALTGERFGDSRFYFPKEMLENSVFTDYLQKEDLHS